MKEKHIIENAKELFAEVGYKATTMDLLAKKCDIGKGTLYLYFSSKEEMLKKVISNLMITVEEKAEEIENMDVPFKKMIDLFLNEMIVLYDEQHTVSKLVYEAKMLGNETVEKYVENLEQHVIDIIASKIDKAIELNYVKKCNSKFTAYLVYKIYVILVREYKEKNNGEVTKEELFELLENIFV